MNALSALLALTVVACVQNADAPGAEHPEATAPSAPAWRLEEPSPVGTVPEHAVVYHTLVGHEAQIVFTTDAPLEKIVGKSNEVVGYAIAGEKENPAKLRGGCWKLPIRSLATGIPLRDEHLAGSNWLDAAKYPAIEFNLTDVESIKQIKTGDGFTTWSATLVGSMALHGVEKAFRIPDTRLSFFAASEKTKAIAEGDLLFVKCDYEVKLSDFGIHNSDVPDKVADSIRISEILRLSSKPQVSAPARKQPEGSK